MELQQGLANPLRGKSFIHPCRKAAVGQMLFYPMCSGSAPQCAQALVYPLRSLAFSGVFRNGVADRPAFGRHLATLLPSAGWTRTAILASAIFKDALAQISRDTFLTSALVLYVLFVCGRPVE